MNEAKHLRNKSFILGGIAAALFLALGLYLWSQDKDPYALIGTIALTLTAFTLVSCLVLENNIIEDVLGEIFSWSFITLPGLIFELSLDGIIWLLTVKLLFWILGILLAILCGILAIVIAGVLSWFVYPIALIKNLKGITC